MILHHAINALTMQLCPEPDDSLYPNPKKLYSGLNKGFRHNPYVQDTGKLAGVAVFTQLLNIATSFCL